jgi:hypothetical protein
LGLRDNVTISLFLYKYEDASDKCRMRLGVDRGQWVLCLKETGIPSGWIGGKNRSNYYNHFMDSH